MASLNDLFTVDKTDVSFTKVNCARRLSAQLLRKLSNSPGILSDFVITTPSGTTPTEATAVQSAPPSSSNFQSSLLAALAENSISVNVTAVSALDVVTNHPTQLPAGTTPVSSGGTPAPSPPGEDEDDSGLSAAVISVIVIVCVMAFLGLAVALCVFVIRPKKDADKGAAGKGVADTGAVDPGGASV